MNFELEMVVTSLTECPENVIIYKIKHKKRFVKIIKTYCLIEILTDREIL